LDGALRRGADVVVVTHPYVLRELAARGVPKPLVFGVLGDASALGVRAEPGDRQPPLFSGSYHSLPAQSLLGRLRYYLRRAERVGVVFNPREPLSVAHKDAMIRDAARPGLTVVALGSELADGVPDAVGRLLDEKVDAIGLVAGLGPACSRVIE